MVQGPTGVFERAVGGPQQNEDLIFVTILTFGTFCCKLEQQGNKLFVLIGWNYCDRSLTIDEV